MLAFITRFVRRMTSCMIIFLGGFLDTPEIYIQIKGCHND